MFTVKRCSLIRGVHYERFHCTVIMAEYEHDIQRNLNLLNDYCNCII